MACCFGGGGAKEEPSGSPHGGSTSREKEEKARLLEEDAKMEEELARQREEKKKAEEEANRLAEEKRVREEEAKIKERERLEEEASHERSMKARAAAGTQGAVVRKELRRMSPREQKRFCAALHHLMLPKELEETAVGTDAASPSFQRQLTESCPGTSEYFRIAGCRGWPSELCQRGEETFPGWHRGYLLELERALVQADLALGNDGDVGLPYWDWLSIEDGGNEVVPKCIRDAFSTLPLGLVPLEEAGNLGTLGFNHLASDVEIKSYLMKANLQSMVASCLSDASHWMLASRRCRRRSYSLEAVHDQVCLGCGFPLSDASYGGFHPLYFLLLCNIDRIYERYLQLETPEECRRDFQLRQEALRENRGEPNRFERALDPFKHPLKKRPLLPTDTFSTADLGYVYEELPQLPSGPQEEFARRQTSEDNSPAECVVADADNNREIDGEEEKQPIFAAFRGLTNSMLGDRSYSLHIFAMHRDDAASWKPPPPRTPPSGWEAPRAAHAGWEELEEYAGCGAVQGGGGSSSSSSSSPPRAFDVLVEVTKTLKSLRLGVHDAELHVLCVDQTGKVVPLEDTPLPPPALAGPLFEEPDIGLCEGCRGGEVFVLQRRLAQLGYDPGPCDGQFGHKVRAAVARFQEFNHLASEGGTAGTLTKARLAAQRKDLAPDLGAPTIPKRFVDGETVPYTVLTLPRHLHRQEGQVLEEIAHAFSQWGKATNLTFAPTEDGGPPPVLTICFEDLSEQGAAHHGGLARQGGQLSESAKDGITLDAAEHWLLRGQEAPCRRPKAVRLYPVLVHAIGHCLGLPHSSDQESVMWPYYDHHILETRLTEQDELFARGMVKNTKPCGCDFKEPPKACSVQ